MSSENYYEFKDREGNKHYFYLSKTNNKTLISFLDKTSNKFYFKEFDNKNSFWEDIKDLNLTFFLGLSYFSFNNYKILKDIYYLKKELSYNEEDIPDTERFNNIARRIYNIDKRFNKNGRLLIYNLIAALSLFSASSYLNINKDLQIENKLSKKLMYKKENVEIKPIIEIESKIKANNLLKFIRFFSLPTYFYFYYNSQYNLENRNKKIYIKGLEIYRDCETYIDKKRIIFEKEMLLDKSKLKSNMPDIKLYKFYFREYNKVSPYLCKKSSFYF